VRRAPTSTGFDNEDAESFEDAEQLRDTATPEAELLGIRFAAPSLTEVYNRYFEEARDAAQ